MLLISLAIACSAGGEPLSAEAERGREVYRSNCTACHHADPGKTGPVGPAVKGSSRELVEARVLHAGYPAGYTPKRTTTQMVALPQLKGEIDALAAYLK
jgi:mono/diheme cytochrome c family protein